MMKKVLFAFAIVFIGSLLPIETSSGRPIQDTGKPEPAKKQIAVDEDLLIVFEDEPHEKFQQAREYFLERNLKASASAIRKGSAYLKLEEKRSTGEGKELLDEAIMELDRLADDVESGVAPGVNELDRAFAGAEYALARHYHLKALEEMNGEDRKRTGHDAASAVTHFENTMRWNGEKIEAKLQELLDETRRLANALIEGGGAGFEEVGMKLEQLGKELEGAKKKDAPAKK